MILQVDEMLRGKSRVFKRLLGRSHPLSLYTFLTLRDRSTVSSAVNSPGSSADGGGVKYPPSACHDDIYCLPQDIINDAEMVATSRSPPALPPRPPVLSRPPVVPRCSSNSSTSSKGNIFKNMKKRSTKIERGNSSVQETQCQSEDDHSITYDDFESVNFNCELEREEKSDEVKVKTLALCWWSDKLNNLTDAPDNTIILDPVFEGKMEEIRIVTMLLSGSTILTPTFQSAEVCILFGHIYEIPELVDVNVQWITKHLKPSNFLETLELYDHIRKFGECRVLESAIRKFMIKNVNDMLPILSKVIEQNVKWIEIVGLNYIPIKLLQAVNPKWIVLPICNAIETELRKSREALETSPLMIKLLSADFKMFMDNLEESATDAKEMKALAKIQRMLTKKTFSTIRSTSFASLVNSIEAYIMGGDDEATDLESDKEMGLFSKKRWRSASAGELLLVFQDCDSIDTPTESKESNGLIEFVVVEIVLDWIKFNKFQFSAELCVNLLAAVRKLDSLSADFVEAMMAEAHALLGPPSFSCIISGLSPSPEPSAYKHVTQAFTISKENIELLVLDQLVTLKAKCTLEQCPYAGTLSVVILNLINNNSIPIIQLNLPPSKNESNIEHTHYDYVHWCITDHGQSQLHGTIHLVSVMTRTIKELKSGLAALDGCRILFFAKR